jgi:protein-tyrosine phosphatase
MVPLRDCPLDVSRIAPKLYQGSKPQMGGAVGRCGFDMLVLAAQEYQPRHAYPGVRVFHAPLDDSGVPITADEWRIAHEAGRAVADALGRGDRVLVTCSMGINRSGLVAALGLHYATGMSGPMAAARVKRRRPGALRNLWFRAMLETVPAQARGVARRPRAAASSSA